MSFASFPLGINVALFVASCIVVWIAGNRLVASTDTLAERKNLSRAFLGLLLLGVATSLPEIATTLTASIMGNVRLASSNLLGGVALQIAILAVIDLLIGRGPLTYFSPQPVLLLQGVMLILLLSVTIAGIAAGEKIAFANVGLTPILLACGYVALVQLSRDEKSFPRWRVTNLPEEFAPKESAAAARPEEHKGASNRRLVMNIVLSCATILAAGWTIALAGDALAEQTGLSSSFVGFALVAGGTSLPELSTCAAAVKRGAYAMAIANIFGTNCLEIALFFPADLAYRRGAILAEAEPTTIFAAALGLVLTAVFLLGLLERRDRAILRMGVDSIMVLVIYAAGAVVFYFLT